MKIFGGYLSAYKLDWKTTPAIVVAESLEVADTKFVEHCLSVYPETDGYTQHRTEAIEATPEQIHTVYLETFHR